MRKIALILIGSLLLIACKKNNITTTTATTTVSHAGLVKSITQKTHKLDSSGHFHTTVDSFLYDNQNRVSDYFRLNYDTAFLLDTNGNMVSSKPSILTDTYILNYADNNLLPDSIIVDGTTYKINYNSSDQFVSVTGPPNIPVSNYTYFNGLIVGFTGSLSGSYSVDSTTLDVNENVTSQILGGNYSLNSSNQFVYGRIALWQYTYSNIANPVYIKKSVSMVLFLATSFIQSKNISASREWVSYGQNSTIVKDEVSTFQNTVDANHLIQTSSCIENGDLTTWRYY